MALRHHICCFPLKAGSRREALRAVPGSGEEPRRRADPLLQGESAVAPPLPPRRRLIGCVLQVLILEQADGRGVELRSYVLPNEPVDEKVPLERFLVPVETIERASGLLFVPNILRRTGGLKAVAGPR